MKDARQIFAPVPLPGASNEANAPGEIVAQTGRWARNAPLAALVEAFGEEVPDTSAGEILAFLDKFSERWNFRGGKERNLSEDPEFDTALNSLIIAAAQALGMMDPDVPRRDKYSHILVLGGLVRACATRPRHAARLINGGLTTQSVTALTAFRPLGGDETDLAAAGQMDSVSNEYEVMRAGMATAFAVDINAMREIRKGPPEGNGMELHGIWHLPGLDIELLVAPSPDLSRRANTADTYRYWATDRSIGADDHLLVVTTSIYAPQQHCDAVRVLTLGYGCHVETTGIDTTTESPPWRQQFTPAKYLQEVRSAIRAVKELRTAASSLVQT
jgi:hypothetical protein